MCGHDLRIQKKRRQRVSWIDALLVLAVLAVLAVWWRIASEPRADQPGEEVAAILPTNIPMLTETAAVSETIAITTPPTATPLPTAAANGVIRHRVRQGETLLAIATQYGITVEEIQAANNLSNELIRAGDELIIPVAGAAQAEEPVEVAPVEQGETVESRFQYTVQPGDTIVSIAARFGSTVEEILIANNLINNDFIRPGDVLLIPVSDVPTEVLDSTSTVSETASAASNATTAIYAEPRLIGPPDDGVVPTNEAVLLRWISVDVLEPNEWYVLLIYPISGTTQNFPSIWTKATSYRLDPELAPPAGDFATYVWQVSVVRVLPGPGGQYGLEAASPPSELRSFNWR